MFHFNPGGRVGTHIIIALIVFVGLAAIIIWVADWTSAGARPTAIDVLNRRLARGEIDRAEYDEKRKQSVGKTRRRNEPCAISYYSSALWRRSARFASAAAV